MNSYSFKIFYIIALLSSSFSIDATEYQSKHKKVSRCAVVIVALVTTGLVSQIISMGELQESFTLQTAQKTKNRLAKLGSKKFISIPLTKMQKKEIIFWHNAGVADCQKGINSTLRTRTQTQKLAYAQGQSRCKQNSNNPKQQMTKR